MVNVVTVNSNGHATLLDVYLITYDVTFWETTRRVITLWKGKEGELLTQPIGYERREYPSGKTLSSINREYLPSLSKRVSDHDERESTMKE
jgi:hypothetical protein